MVKVLWAEHGYVESSKGLSQANEIGYGVPEKLRPTLLSISM
jgi:hypothetical protein